MSYRVEFYQDSENYWRWRLRSVSGAVVADCGCSYKRKYDCVRSWSRISTAVRNDRVRIA